MLMNLLYFALFSSFSLLVVLFIVTLVLYTRAMGWLKEKHFEKWDELGRLSFTNSSMSNSLAILSFMRTRGFLSLNDSELTKRYTVLWNFLRLYFVVFGLTVIIGLMFISENPK